MVDSTTFTDKAYNTYYSAVNFGKDLCKTGSLALSDIYSTDGLSKGIKFALPVIKYLGLKECEKTLGGLKDLYYATGWGSIADFYKDGQLQWPKTKSLVQAVVNSLEALKFCQNYGIYAFEKCTQVSNCIGSYRVYGSWAVRDIPFISNLASTPKDLFVAMICYIDIKENLKNLTIKEKDKEKWNIEAVCKIANSFGKMGLILTGSYLAGKTVFLGLDFFTNTAALIGFIWKKQQERAKLLA